MRVHRIPVPSPSGTGAFPQLPAGPRSPRAWVREALRLLVGPLPAEARRVEVTWEDLPRWLRMLHTMCSVR